MSEHDPFCPTKVTRYSEDQVSPGPVTYITGVNSCQCSLIARVRADERSVEGAVVLTRAAYQDGVQAARDALVAAGHTPWGIYDECECPAEVREQDGHIINLIEFSGCEKSLVYWACRECCTDDGYHNEACATYHDHGEGKPYCLALGAIDALKGEQA